MTVKAPLFRVILRGGFRNRRGPARVSSLRGPLLARVGRWEALLEQWAAAREFNAAYRRCGGS